MTEDKYRQLLEEVCNGNRLAFNTIYERYYRPLCAYCFSLVGSYDLVKDIVQNVFVRVWENRATLDQINNFESYLYTSARNHCWDHIKRLEVKDKYKSYILAVSNADYSQDVEYEIKELTAAVKSKIETLSPACKNVYEQKMLGLSNKEISQKLNIAVKTVEWHVSIAKKEIKKIVDGYML